MLKSTNYEASHYVVYSSFLLLPLPSFHLLPANTFSLALFPFLRATDQLPLSHKVRGKILDLLIT